MTDNPRKCPQCSAELPPDAPEGLCPACLLQNGFPSEPAAGPDSGLITPEMERLFPDLEFIECLGQGGMGVVYKARQKELDRIVAFKVMKVAAAKDPAFAERFTREARALAKLDHPNIVSVFDFGQAEGRFFLLMEHVDGANLRQVIRTKTIKPDEALEIVPKICHALQYAHDQGVVHRDIKPENILISKDGRVKIADFGLAKMMGPEEREYTLTQEGMTMGTVRYMAPEQMDEPQSVDHRADIYSLGVVFYELLTGEVPMGRFAPPSKKVEVDVRLDEVVMRALAREPELRFQQASDVRTEVETIVRDPDTPGPVAESPRLSGAALWGAGLVTMSLCFAVAVVSLAKRNFTISEWWFFLMLCVSTGVAGSACATAAVFEIKNSKGRVRGLRIAAAAAIGFPLIGLGGVLMLALDPANGPLAALMVGCVGWAVWEKICGRKGGGAEPDLRPQFSWKALAGVVLGALGILIGIYLMRRVSPELAQNNFSDYQMTLRRLIMSVIIGGTVALSPVLGWQAVREINGSSGRLKGLRMGLLAMFLIPGFFGFVIMLMLAGLLGGGWAWEGEIIMLGIRLVGVGLMIRLAYSVVKLIRSLAKGGEMKGVTTGVVAYATAVVFTTLANLAWPIGEWVLLQVAR